MNFLEASLTIIRGRLEIARQKDSALGVLGTNQRERALHIVAQAQVQAVLRELLTVQGAQDSGILATIDGISGDLQTNVSLVVGFDIQSSIGNNQNEVLRRLHHDALAISGELS
jgi:hypothetical protein